MRFVEFDIVGERVGLVNADAVTAILESANMDGWSVLYFSTVSEKHGLAVHGTPTEVAARLQPDAA